MDDEPPEERLLVPFEPPLRPSGNGSHARGRAHPLRGVAFGFLIGALLSTFLVTPTDWLQLDRGRWITPAVAGLGAGAMVGAFRRDRFRIALLGGAIASCLSLWAVYGMVQLGLGPLNVRSPAGRIVRDLGRLLLWGAPAGLAGALAGWHVRRALVRDR
ncbi:MAG TPA: hypothetical protein VGB83_00695 [Actinomycetota bacterium]